MSGSSSNQKLNSHENFVLLDQDDGPLAHRALGASHAIIDRPGRARVACSRTRALPHNGIPSICCGTVDEAQHTKRQHHRRSGRNAGHRLPASMIQRTALRWSVRFFRHPSSSRSAYNALVVKGTGEVRALIVSSIGRCSRCHTLKFAGERGSCTG